MCCCPSRKRRRSVDYFQWTAILRSSRRSPLSLGFPRKHQALERRDLLILRPQMPRSLISCYDNIVRFLDSIGNEYGRHGPRNAMRATSASLENASIKEVFQSGLHEFVDSFVTDNNQLGTEIAEQYLIG